MRKVKSGKDLPDNVFGVEEESKQMTFSNNEELKLSSIKIKKNVSSVPKNKMTAAQKSRKNKLKPELEIESESEDNTD